jgi:hypothetical protein
MSRGRVASVEIEARMSDRIRAVSRRASSNSFFVGAWKVQPPSYVTSLCVAGKMESNL